jgi:uroporphyrinogen decarboxylase
VDKRARVLAALEGRRVDRVPFTMWRCAYLQAESAQGLARSTLDFSERYDVDLLVLTPRPYYLAEAWGADVRSFSSDALAPYLGSPTVAHATEWRRLPPLDLPTSVLRREVEAVRLVRGQLGEGGPPLVIQVPSPLATADALCSGRIVSDLRTYPGDVRAGLSTIAAETARFLRACLEAGADGAFFLVPFASPDELRPRESRAFGLAFDLQVLEALPGAAVRILYLDTDNPDLTLAARYPVRALGWQAGPASPSLADVGKSFRGTRIGGLDPLTLSAGSVSDLQAQVAEALSQTGGWHLILAPAGALPANARQDLLAAVGSLLDEVQPGARRAPSTSPAPREHRAGRPA